MQGNSKYGIYKDVFLDLKNVEIPMKETKTTFLAAFQIDNSDTSVVFDDLMDRTQLINVIMVPIAKGSLKMIPNPFKKKSDNVIDSQKWYDSLIDSQVAQKPQVAAGGKKTKKRRRIIKKKKRISKRHKKRRISRKYKKQKSKYTVTKSYKR